MVHDGESVAPRPDSSSSASPARDFLIAGVGASAGGLEALQALIRRFSKDNLALIIVQHLSPVHESLLAELLARATTMKVVTAEEGQVIESNTIYVQPAHADLELREGRLHLKEIPAHRPVPRLPIDSFLRSLAKDRGARAVGVILSGGGSDGTLGLRAIKEVGGLTFVQDPGTATHANMPQAALDAGCADFCLPPEQIGDELGRLAGDHVIPALDAAPPPMSVEDVAAMNQIFGQIRANFGVDFTQYRHSTLERRIRRRMVVCHLDAIATYLAHVQKERSELDLLYRDMLIGVTSFFRDPDVFEALKSAVFPRLLERRPEDAAIRMWVPGCSTGEEAYSICMALLEHLGDRAARYSIQIFATDLDDESIRLARLGIYPPNIELDVSRERLHRFFVRSRDEYQISRTLREMIVFASQDVTKDPPFSRLDLISCRNVLIYMQPTLQKRVLRTFHYGLAPAGYLVLGTSETVGEQSDLFGVVDRKLKVYVKLNVPASVQFDFSWASHGHRDRDERRAGGEKPLNNIQQVADRSAIERYAPPGVIVNDALDVLQFRGRTGAYLEPAPGAATLNVLKLARPELLIELRTTINKALAENFAAVSHPVHLKTEGGFRRVVLEAIPLHDATIPPRCLLVVFREARPGESNAEAPEEAGGGEGAHDPRFMALQRELGTTKDYLQSTIEELEASNEELQSSNEELQSSNEELQSTNEELETSKEELQSTNEELGTVNDELQNRMGELGQNIDDLQNVLAVVGNPVILVGLDLRIRRFSKSAEAQMNLISGDIGRPAGHLRGFLNLPNVEQLLADVISRAVPAELDVKNAEDREYHMKLTPYTTADHAIRGVVMEFLPRAPQGNKSDG